MVSRITPSILIAVLLLAPVAASATPVTLPAHDINVSVNENTTATIDLFALGLDGYTSSTDLTHLSSALYSSSSGASIVHFPGIGYLSATGQGTLSVPLDAGAALVGYTPGTNYLGPDYFYYQLFDQTDPHNVLRSAIQIVNITVAPPQPSCVLTATPSSVALGAASTLSWTSTNATGLSLDQGIGTELSLASSTDVAPTVATLYTMTATSTNGTATCSASVAILDTTPPVITMLGDNPLALTVGDTFADPGATATDDTAVTATSTSGTVDTTTAGSYTLTYTASDAAGNTATSTREVDVAAAPVATPAPVVSSGGGGGGSSFRSGGSAPVTVVAPIATTTASGEVLGASTYHFTKQLGRGSTGPDVVALQEFLANDGEYVGVATGYFGAQTKAAVLAFQIKNKVTGANGHVGPATLALLNRGVLPATDSVATESIKLQLAAAFSALTALLAQLHS